MLPRKAFAAAAQSLGRRVERGSEGIEEIVRGALVAAMQNAAAKKSLADLHSARSALTEEVHKAIAEQAQRLGLSLITASIIRIDQSDLSHFDERNAFDAQGMRRHAELVAEQRRERVRIETETEIAVRESALARHQRQLEIERTEKAALIANQEAIDRLEAENPCQDGAGQNQLPTLRQNAPALKASKKSKQHRLPTTRNFAAAR